MKYMRKRACSKFEIQYIAINHHVLRNIASLSQLKTTVLTNANKNSYDTFIRLKRLFAIFNHVSPCHRGT